MSTGLATVQPLKASQQSFIRRVCVPAIAMESSKYYYTWLRGYHRNILGTNERNVLAVRISFPVSRSG